jgi:hypothetical protein
MALAGMLVICYSLEHSIYRYKPLPASTTGQLLFYLNAAPSQFLVVIAILGVKIGYTIASSFDWIVSPLRYDVDSGWIYGLGYTPAILIIAIFNVCGYCDLNEDKALIARRDELKHALASDGKKDGRCWKKNKRLRSVARVVTGRGSLPDDEDGEDMARHVEMGVIKPRQQAGEGVVGSELNKEDPRVTTRHASHSSSTTDGADSSPHRVEYSVQGGNLERSSSDDTRVSDVQPQMERKVLDR